MNVKEERDALIKSALETIERAEKRGGFTDVERADLKAKEKEITELNEHLEKAAEDSAIFSGLGGGSFVPDFSGKGGAGGGSFAPTSEGAPLAVHPAGIKSVAGNLAKGLTVSGPGGQKSLIATGSTATATVIARDLAGLPQVPTSILSLIQTVPLDSPVYRYLRQVAPRTNNAAVVAPGAEKPTSPVSLESVEGSLVVVAHLSEGIDKYALLDVRNLQTFVEAELRFGLATKMEDLVINGSGAGGDPLGILKHSGVLTQAFETDLVTSIRKAITQIESQGYQASAVCLRPEDWESIELLTTSGSGEFVVNSPVDRAARRLFGIQVVVSSALEVGTAMVADLRQAMVFSDRRGVMAEWTQNSGTDFEHNLQRLRVETRMNVGVGQPSAVVQVATAATP